MKKLRLSNIFHWLYAFLMFLPILYTFGFIVVASFNQNLSFVDEPFWIQLAKSFKNFIPSYLFIDGELSAVEDSLYGIFEFFLGSDNDPGTFLPQIRELFVYWVEVSFLYIVFDIIMFPINLAHRWIDKGGIE